MNLKRLILILPLLVTFAFMRAQDPVFSQFYANRLYLNPAMAGIEAGRRIFLNYRNQSNNAYVTYSASFDQYIEPMHGGLGISVMNDVQGSGSLNQLNFSAMYSYHVKVSRALDVSGGLEASWVQRKLSASRFVYGDQIDPATGDVISGSESYADLKKDFPDFAVGMASFYKNYYGGVSLSHVFKPVQSLSNNPDARLPRKFIYFMGAFIPVYEKRFGREFLQLNPNLIYLQQRNLSQLCYGMEVLVQDRYAAGFLVRQNLGIKYSSFILSAGVSVSNMRFRYSYDAHVPLPSYSFSTGGAHEISLIGTFKETRKINRKAIKCPKF